MIHLSHVVRAYLFLIKIDISMFFVSKGATYVEHMQIVLIVAKGKLECGQLLSH